MILTVMLLIESNPNARENSVQIRKTNDPDWNVVKSRMSLFRGVVKVRENSVPTAWRVPVATRRATVSWLTCTAVTQKKRTFSNCNAALNHKLHWGGMTLFFNCRHKRVCMLVRADSTQLACKKVYSVLMVNLYIIIFSTKPCCVQDE